MFPSSILRVTICKENGLRAEGATTSAMTEYFLSGTLPTQSCTDPIPTITDSSASPTPTDDPGGFFFSDPTPTPDGFTQPTVTPTDTPTQQLLPTLPITP